MGIGLYCFSGSGHTRAIADYFAGQLNISVSPLPDKKMEEAKELAIVLFPVYSQNLPDLVRVSLPHINAQRFILIATYGRMSFGNVLQEASLLIHGKVIAAAYVPTGHTYLSEGPLFDVGRLQPLFEKIDSTQEIAIPSYPKNPFANFLPSLRSRLGVHIIQTAKCTKCGLCTQKCPISSMHDGHPDNHCIRCLRCVAICPQKALTFQLHPFMKWYLRETKEERFLLFL